MSAGNDFWATRAGNEFLAAVKNIALEAKERNRIEEEKIKILDSQNKLIREQTDMLGEILDAIKYLR